MRVQITRSAEQDLLNGFAFYERQQAGIGEYFLDSLYADIDSLILYGGIHTKPLGRLHRTIAKRLPGIRGTANNAIPRAPGKQYSTFTAWQCIFQPYSKTRGDLPWR